MSIKYRPEIDGLRFIAVFAVIIYHADIYFNNKFLLPGGFLGVDIFFVISGYLIGKLIHFQINTGSFSINSFLIRRIRRIFPALFFMCFLSAVFGYFFLFSASFTDLLNSIMSSIFFISNYHYYFSGHVYGADTLLVKPLIHTWSLSIEIQFYLIISILIFILSKKKFQKTSNFIYIFLIFLSFFISNSLVHFNNNLNFYFILTRLWELLTGYYLVNIEKKNNKFITKYSIQLTFISLSLIIFSFIFFSNEKFHPTFKTLPIVIGTSLFILFIKNSPFLLKIFSNKILVFLGLMSYSLYIWHYPIFVFSKYLNITQGEILNKFMIIIVLFVSSYLSFNYIEKPFRTRNNYFFKNFKYFFSYSIIFSSLFFLYFFYSNNYFLNFKNIKLSEKLNDKFYFDNKFYLDEFNDELKKYENLEYSNNNKKKVLIVGNSYGADMFLIFKRNEKLFYKYDFSYLNTQFYCLEVIITNNSKCKMDNNLLYKKLKETDVIVISTRWNKNDFDNFHAIIQALKAYNNEIIIVSRYEFLTEDQFTITDIFGLKEQRLPNENEIVILGNEYYRKRTLESKKIRSFLYNYSAKNELDLLDFSSVQCNHNSKYCNPISDFNFKIYYDKGHLTLDGIDFFSKKLSQLFKF